MELSRENCRPVLNRLRRASGQLTAVIKMLEEGKECGDVATQLAAVSKAVDHAGFQLLLSGLRQCQVENAEEIDTSRLEKLFLAFS